MYNMQSLKVKNGKSGFINLDLEFEGKRAFVVWDAISVGDYLLKARVEIDPGLLQKGTQSAYSYSGQLVLPNPRNN